MGTTGLSLTLANSIIGVGILAMPFCFQQCGVLLATLILLLMGLVSRLCCYFLLKSALLARRSNFEFLAFQVFGPAGKFAVEVGIIGFLMGTCIAYFVVVGDLGPQIISKMFHINQSDILRTSIMVIVSLVCVLPLGLLRNVDSLSNVSAATIGFYFCLVIKVVIEAAGQVFSGDWHTRLELWKPSGVLQCVPIFSMALFCQTQLFEVFESMPTLSLEKMNVVTKNAINICTSVYFTLGVFGYIAFGSQTISGNVLMSLSPTMTSDVIKLGFVMSVAFSFPLIIFPCRASIYSLLFKKVHSVHHDHIVNHSIPQTTFRCITVCIIVVALFVSLLIPNIELVLGLVGSTIGVLICVTFPAACFVNVTFKNTNERILAKGVLILGLVIMILGTYANLQAADNIERYDDRYITQERIDKMVEDFFEKMDKSGGALLKPLDPNENVIKKIEIDDDKIIKDSEVQPPNPVPPESHSLEDKRAKNDNKEKNNVAMKEILAVEKAQIDKVIEKNIMKDTVAAVKPKPDQPIKTPEKLVKDDSKIKDEAQMLNKELKIQANNEKINMIKQQQLIETMKQHGEEQKELIKEQKEILNEIQKTKNDLSKNEIDSNEAKKIAVESIQKIANMAIQSLGGVTDLPPVQSSFEKKSEPLEKLANDAVQQIAKKAAETIEAMKEQQEKVNEAPKQPAVLPPGPAEPILQRINSNSLSAAKPVPIIKNEPKPALPILSAVPAANPPGAKNPPQIPRKVIPVQNQNIQPNVKQQQQIIQNGENAQSILNAVSVNNELKPPVINQKAENVPNNINNPVVEKLPVANIPIANQLAQNVIKDKVVKAHSHSPDEPQSYKQGEDLQKKDIANKNYNLNVPIPVAMNGNSQPVKSAENVIAPIPINNNDKVSNNIVNNGAHDPLAKSRSKREADKYCEKKITDKEIINIKQSEEILPKVDLSDVSLINKIPLDPNVVHHIRSLKSVKDTHKKR